MSPLNEEVSFSFGENWIDFSETINDDVITSCRNDIEYWLKPEWIKDKRVIDVGSGSGLSSLCMLHNQPSELLSFDYDQKSVEAASNLKTRLQSDADNWKIQQGSILDDEFIQSLGSFDVVHSWGVLMLTGDLQTALDNTFSLCRDGGYVFITIYQAGFRYQDDLELKRRYNKASEKQKLKMQYELAEKLYPNFKNRDEDILVGLKNTKGSRGMNLYNDLIDWLGGLPYEVAYPTQILLEGMKRGLEIQKVHEANQGGCSMYLFQKKNSCEGDLSFEWSHMANLGHSETRNLSIQFAKDMETLTKEHYKELKLTENKYNKPLSQLVADRVKRRL